MILQEKSIQCSDCGTTFAFSAEQQKLFVSKGYTNDPKRCSWCRAKRKIKSYGHEDQSYSSRSRW